MRGRLQRSIQILLQVEDTPHRIALAFAIGVWIAFFPILGIHTGLALGLAFLLRLNRAAVVLGAWINNPWTLAPLYMAGTLLGCFLFGVPPQGLAAIDWGQHGRAFYLELFSGLRPYVWPFILGNSLLGVVAGVSVYFALRFLLERRRRAVSSHRPPTLSLPT